jgi:predicted nucleic acid-binding protein
VLVLGEFHAHLLYLAGPARARRVTLDLLEDAIYSWVNVDVGIVSAATSGWLERFSDQKFSLIDAVSFEVMKRNRLSIAFAFDRHFQVAGYQQLQ